ncbi:LytR/AlgR family response regulator transcription factor [Inhella gelatinilytica]|uniref:Response regulator transcription factor n=1 Tax=Inhella gelatinilytica TaxID=2795030 RepID=A0A931NEL9_9BURK|nr:LytTR family DNA-binding domain-containing protein [Inhella gelatinilytica]MBH9554297.1 response regulator transcription factor [Inhella gelatinilytica]
MTSLTPLTALVADDEPLLREALIGMLARTWPELRVVGEARNGREAVEAFERLRPQVVFLDVHMPGLNGVEAARAIRQVDRQAVLVFVTAYDQYAVAAFEQGAIDYLVKPVELPRLQETVQRLQERLSGPAPDPDAPSQTTALLAQIAARLQQGGPSPFLQWIKASVGQALKLIPVDEVVFLRSDEKYTLVVWREGEALIRTPLRELIDQLDPAQFVQVHRSVVVNLRAISHVVRGLNETADIHLKGRPEVLPVSRSYLHLFKQM